MKITELMFSNSLAFSDESTKGYFYSYDGGIVNKMLRYFQVSILPASNRAVVVKMTHVLLSCGVVRIF